MPLPRFDRLPAERRDHILGVARRHFAEHGAEGASYNKIIEAAGVSKTAAYHYFDGREDLLTAVLDGVQGRLLDALGPWEPARDADDFGARFAAGSAALATHLGGHPEDLALADAAIGRTSGGPWLGWFGALVTDGRRIGLIRDDVDHALMVSATAAVVRAADTWALALLTTAPGTGDPGAQLWTLLRGLWGAPAAGQEPNDAH
ncbi:TetR/AcrR family transcriptional regulator [Streptomyces erythrochromogenes]|nr:TetR/AcrR family transcriptional regulator [Streptomyces erythrochromogenes]